ncbi:cytochrome P450 [Colletotrichum graminicola]|nr:cytochrome P450 [Colletotrichum graminicola]
MVSSIVILIGAVVAYSVYANVTGLRRNITEAKKVGLPYVVTRTWEQLASNSTPAAHRLTARVKLRRPSR